MKTTSKYYKIIKAMKSIINKLKREIFGEAAKGEKVVIPDLRKLHRELDKRLSTKDDIEAYNAWCNNMNFGGMHVKK